MTINLKITKMAAGYNSDCRNPC